MDRSILRARSFLKRADDADLYEQRLLCLFDGFVCIFGTFKAAEEAAKAAGVDESLFRLALESCHSDSDSESFASKASLSESQIDSLRSKLAALTS